MLGATRLCEHAISSFLSGMDKDLRKYCYNAIRRHLDLVWDELGIPNELRRSSAVYDAWEAGANGGRKRLGSNTSAWTDILRFRHQAPGLRCFGRADQGRGLGLGLAGRTLRTSAQRSRCRLELKPPGRTPSRNLTVFFNGVR